MKRREQILMQTEFEPKLAIAKDKSLVIRWQEFSEQWRHAYLLVLALFYIVARIAGMVLLRLANIRVLLDDIRALNGLQPGDVLLLMEVLKLIYVPAVACALLYLFSFRIRVLNTSKALAVTSLGMCTILAFVLLVALSHISAW